MPQEKGRLISDQPRPPRYTMPDLKDPQRQIPIQPKFFLASSRAELPRELNSAQLRALAASYVTGQDNPWFAMAYVNRVWYELMGDSFYSPVDDMGPERDAVAAPILDALATQWAAGGFDVRWLFRTLLNTKAYQREARSTQSENGRKPMAANCSSRLRSDQLLDAITRVLEIPENGPGGRAGQAAAAKSQVQGALAAGRPFNGRNVFNVVFGVDPSLPKEDVMGTIPQALFLMNGPAIQGGISAIGNTVLGRILAQNPDNLAALTALYLQVLSRRPNAAEIKTCGEYIQRVGNRREAFEDILWSLINSTEFLSRR